MTKKNSKKTAARARQEKFGGKFLHHRHLLDERPAGSAEPTHLTLTMADVLEIARQSAPEALVGANDAFGASPIVFVVVDASDRFGGAIAATRIAEMKRSPEAVARGEVAAEVQRRAALNESAPFAGVMRVDDLAGALQKTLRPEQIHLSVELIARFSTPAPEGQVHVLGIAAGGMSATLVSSVELCWCGHPVSAHADSGACNWIGVPDGRPIPGLPAEMVEQARALGAVMRCPCAGAAQYLDSSGNVLRGSGR